jgi:hypothetical protein
MSPSHSPPAGISFKMSSMALAGMICAVVGFFIFMICAMVLSPVGAVSFIFGGIGLVIGLMIWKTENNRAKVIVAFSAITLIGAALVAVVVIAMGI